MFLIYFDVPDVKKQARKSAIKRGKNMPPKCKFTKEQIIEAALALTREQGIEAVTARSVAARLSSSPKVIFSLFHNMEELQAEVLRAAQALYKRRIEEGMSGGEYPPYKGSGMAYVQFAKEEKQLFRLLFMRDRSAETVGEDRESVRPQIELIEKNLGLDEDTAYLFHLEMWLYVHGIAATIATSYSDWDTALVSRMLTDGFLGLKHRYESAKEQARKEGE